MSKKRLYEIAKELGKESKEVVTRAKELGFDVKSHASSVDTDVAEKLIKSFAAKKETVEKKVAEVAAKTTAVAAKKEAAPVKKEGATETKSVTPAAKPKSRNFKAEREARAKEQAERRKQQGNRPKRDRKDNQRYGDNWWTLYQLIWIQITIFNEEAFDIGIVYFNLFLGFNSIIHHQEFNRISIQRLVLSRHDSHHKEFLDDFSRFTLDAFCDFCNRHSIRILKFTW